MDTGAIVMFLIGAVGLWGTLALAIVNYLRRSAADRRNTVDEAG
ncbi:MAG TPA: MetS family NSS transporter small subunit [Actinoplanes sp.]|nr:MetS family NSS transporter small subunit [Actinoplanes sp.]